MIAIKTDDLTQDFTRVADRVMKGEVVLISRPQSMNLVLITEEEYTKLQRVKSDRVQKRLGNLHALQTEASTNSIPMTEDEIIDDIRQYRKETQV